MCMDDIGREPTPLANHVTQVRQVLSQHLPWSPHSFIRRLSFEGDREWYAQELTRELAGDTDLRFVFRNRAEQALAVFCEVLPWDSEFFGKTVARLSAVSPLEPPFYDRDLEYGEAVNHVLELCQERGVRYLFAQVDPRDLALLRALDDHGFRLIETRAHYYMPLEDFAPADRFAARLAVPADVPSLARTASEMVNNFDRFHADPAIPKELADKLMARWVEASIEGGFSDGAIVPAVPTPPHSVLSNCTRNTGNGGISSSRSRCSLQ